MKLEQRDGVALVRMEAGKANAISPELLGGLDDLFDQIESSDARAAVIIGYDRFFSAGLALPSLLPLDRPTRALPPVKLRRRRNQQRIHRPTSRHRTPHQPKPPKADH